MSSSEDNVTTMEPVNPQTYTFYFEINKNNYKNICIPLPFLKSFKGYKLDNLWNNNKECYDCNVNENEFNYPILNSKQRISLSNQGGLPLPPNTFIILDELKGSDIVTFQCASSTEIQGCTPYSSSRICFGDYDEEIEITPIPSLFDKTKSTKRITSTSSDTIKCAANHGSTKPCCGQEGGTVQSAYICPSSKPVCKDYIYGKNWGSCVVSEGYGNIKENFEISSITNKNKLSIPISCSGKSCLSFFPPHLASIEKKETNLNETINLKILENLKPCSGSSFSLSEGFPACTDNNGNPVQLCVSGNPKFNYTVYIPNSYRKSPRFNSNSVYEKPVFFNSGFYNHSDFLATLSLLQSSTQEGDEVNLPEGTFAIYEVSYTLVMNSNLEFQLMDFLYLQNKLSGTFTDWFKKTKVYTDSIGNIQKLIFDFCAVSKNSPLCKQKINLPNLENQIENFELPKQNKNTINYIILFICILLIFFIYYRKLYV